MRNSPPRRADHGNDMAAGAGLAESLVNQSGASAFPLEVPPATISGPPATPSDDGVQLIPLSDDGDADGRDRSGHIDGDDRGICSQADSHSVISAGGVATGGEDAGAAGEAACEAAAGASEPHLLRFPPGFGFPFDSPPPVAAAAPSSAAPAVAVPAPAGRTAKAVAAAGPRPIAAAAPTPRQHPPSTSDREPDQVFRLLAPLPATSQAWLAIPNTTASQAQAQAHLVTLAGYGVRHRPHPSSSTTKPDPQSTAEAAETLARDRPESPAQALDAHPERYRAGDNLGSALALAHAHCLRHDLLAADTRVDSDATYARLVSRMLAAMAASPGVVSLMADADMGVKNLLGVKKLPALTASSPFEGTNTGPGFALGLRSDTIEIAPAPMHSNQSRLLRGPTLIPLMKARNLVWSNTQNTLTESWFPWLLVEAGGLWRNTAQPLVRLLSSMRFVLGTYAHVHAAASAAAPEVCAPRSSESRRAHGLLTLGALWQLYVMQEDNGTYAVETAWVGYVHHARDMAEALGIIHLICKEAVLRRDMVRNWITCVCGDTSSLAEKRSVAEAPRDPTPERRRPRRHRTTNLSRIETSAPSKEIRESKEIQESKEIRETTAKCAGSPTAERRAPRHTASLSPVSGPGFERYWTGGQQAGALQIAQALAELKLAAASMPQGTRWGPSTSASVSPSASTTHSPGLLFGANNIAPLPHPNAAPRLESAATDPGHHLHTPDLNGFLDARAHPQRPLVTATRYPPAGPGPNANRPAPAPHHRMSPAAPRFQPTQASRWTSYHPTFQPSALRGRSLPPPNANAVGAGPGPLVREYTAMPAYASNLHTPHTPLSSGSDATRGLSEYWQPPASSPVKLQPPPTKQK